MVEREGELATGRPLRPLALAGLTVLLIGLCLLLALPFLPAIVWGVALAIIAWPLHARVARLLPAHPSLAAGLTAAVVLAILVAAASFVIYNLMREAESATDSMRADHAEGAIRHYMMRNSATAGIVAWADRANLDIDTEARKLVNSLARDGTALAQGSMMALIQTAVAFFILFYLLRDQTGLLAGSRRLLPMTRAEADRVFVGIAGSVHANLYGAIVTSTIDAVTGGLVFWAVGLPSPVLWGVVMFVLALVPVAGIFMVWVPASIYLALTDNWGGAAAVAAWGVACSVLIDTLLYTRLAGDRMRLHPVPTLLAFVGGLAVFGAAGMILGPAILAVTVSVLEVWHWRATTDEPAPAPEPTAS